MGQKARMTSTTKTRVKKNGNPNEEGYMQCNICHGTGIQKKPKKKS